MPKKSQIRWRDKDVKELERVVRNFNSKIKRVKDKNPNATEFLPDKISVKALKGTIGTRQDFNRELNSLKRFSKKGAEKLQTTPTGLTLTSFEIQEAKIKTRIVNIKRAYERKALGVTEREGVMGQVSERGLRPKKFSLNKSAKEWERFVQSLEKEISSNFKIEQLEKYKENYLKGLINNLGEKGAELAQLLDNVDPDILFTKSVTNPLLSIDFIYDPLELETIIDAKIEAWQEEL